MIKARAAVLREAGQDPQLTDVELRDPVGDEVLVRIDAVGICHTDISVAAHFAKVPMVFGHEGAGTVVAVGPQATRQVGEPVVLTFASCGTCGYCVADRPAYCDQSTNLNMRGSRRDESSALRLDGAPITGGFFGQSSFATYAIAGSRNAVPLPAGMDPALAAPLGCSVQTGAGAVLNVLGAPDSVVVFGAGAVGLSAVMGARIAGARTIIAVDPIAERRSLATELGATATIDPTATDAAAAVLELTGGVAAAVDTTARPDVIAAAVGVLAARGTLALLGLGAMTAELPVVLIMAKGLTVRGVVEGDSDPHVFIPRLVQLFERGDLPLQKLVSTYAFDDFDRAWADAKNGAAIKPVLVTGR
ncbi:NAD(P)-dependent alcohol dehydrogenase [Mycolicibacterium diernhoferi]|uniref:Aryl-alcohol dehydrogenase n=1 Tax=Mycolicibacterium diernhoferi TaxID=1801 RepID=A0A1Q4H5F5_9MYCO|nr:NAD(P)-dependent alcohol dehydrogenase [Mycolicibacterium diernhoferi]OJZ62790.1 aryl-alcohol dehydrogenase [Mycolicibacterium diernhoferi]OPE53552.1 aryl-alcohol dehydrogenase [Mycolicibacterium diernhoferi]PEG55429.1 NAD(P)-dependent alcohol dehydrogenase [Mycolicibacterium diernhoferi]QYL24347.1 NAD(P)-dependent alcohol dehydrogenase [Mycolicibacterium diernhoferi]